MNEHNSSIENWDEVRVAYHVARLGTLSAAAKYLNVHHATVIRHVNALEGKLGCKLFQRNPRGYYPTEAGRELLQRGANIDSLLSQLAGKLKGQSEAVSGELIVTSLSALSQRLTPLLIRFGEIHPEVRIKFITNERRLQLEYGEAHLALRAGAKPQEPHNVVQPLTQLAGTLFAHKSYVEKFGAMNCDSEGCNHHFIGTTITERRAPFLAWMDEFVPEENVTFQTSDMRSYEDAVMMGAGIGYLSMETGTSNPDLVQMMPPLPEWETTLWLVTHVDLHRTAKVQALANFLKAEISQDAGKFAQR